MLSLMQRKLKEKILSNSTKILSNTITWEGGKKIEPDSYWRCAEKRGNGHNLEHRIFQLDIKKFLSSQGWSHTGVGHPEKLCVLPP